MGTEPALPGHGRTARHVRGHVRLPSQDRLASRVFPTPPDPRGGRGKESLVWITQLVLEGKLQPVLDRVLPLKEAQLAHQLLEQRQQFGKVVLVPE